MEKTTPLKHMKAMIEGLPLTCLPLNPGTSFCSLSFTVFYL